MKIITRTIWILSLVSLFTDIASEMLYPIMPIYLKSIHFSVLLIGILEGFAEAIAGLSKGYFGKRSDNIGKRLPFVQWGYMLSAISKPMMAILTFPVWIFSARTLDRLGKGMRTGARDAMLSDEATTQTKGRVFGFHRAMDTFGAVLGPTTALLFLYFYPEQYKTLFYLAFIPGVIAIAFTLFIKEKKGQHSKENKKTKFLDFIHYWKSSPSLYRKIVAGLLVFTLFNSSDVFMLLKIKESGVSDTATIGVYIFYNMVYAALSYPLGALADRIGLKRILMLGLLLFSAVYGIMSFTDNLYLFLIAFFLYGAYAAATEGIAKAWISNVSDKKDTATAIGTFTSFQSICTMLASSMAGLIWLEYGAMATFIATSIVTLIVFFYFFVLKENTANNPNS
ncbi:MAG: MFS transporter [Bacteroidetes bacterium]|nr:MFS transporter [Bacteroidota bacterium]